MVALGTESVLISFPGQGDFLALGRDVISGSLVGVSSAIFGFLVVRVLVVAAQLFLGLGLLAGSSVRSSEAAKL